MTPLQRKDLEKIQELEEQLAWEPYTRWRKREVPTWVIFVIWCVLITLVGVLAVFALDKLEAAWRVKWPWL